MKTFTIFILAMVLCCVFPVQGNADFVDGNYFSTDINSTQIQEYDSNGNHVGTISPTLGSNEILRGTAFGKDGLLYAVAPSHSGPARVISLDSSGNILDSYHFTSFTGGNVSYGKMAFGNNGKFYVTSGVGVVEFTVGDTTSANLINSSGGFDIDILPNGNLLVAEDYAIKELAPNGTVVRTINLSDPYGNAAGASVGFTNLRGLAYDAIDDVIYATHLGHTGFNFRLMKLEASTGYLLDHEYFWYGDEISLGADGTLAVASRTQNPGFFNQDLAYLGSFGDGDGRYFISQYQAVPEPLGAPALAFGSMLLLTFRRRRIADRH